MKYVIIYLIIGMVIAWLAVEVGNSDAKKKGMTFTEAHDQMMMTIGDEIGVTDKKIDVVTPPIVIILAIVFLWILFLIPAIIRYFKKK